MRALFWILLAGNLMLFALLQWGGLLAGREQPEPAQLPLHEELIRLQTTSPQSAPAAIAAIAAASAPAVPPVTVTVPIAAAASAPVAATVKSGALACYEWGDFTGADLTQASASLSELKLGDKLSQTQVEHAISYWVYIPPQPDKVKLNQKIAQLKARGVTEYFVVQDAGQWQNAISLGVFKTSEAAQKFLEGLSKKDVRTARTGERNSKFNATTFRLNGVDEAVAAKLTLLQQSFPGSEVKKVDCPLTR